MWVIRWQNKRETMREFTRSNASEKKFQSKSCEALAPLSGRDGKIGTSFFSPGIKIMFFDLEIETFPLRICESDRTCLKIRVKGLLIVLVLDRKSERRGRSLNFGHFAAPLTEGRDT